jgi:hypothetical protein
MKDQSNWYEEYRLNELQGFAYTLDVPLTAIHMLVQCDTGYTFDVRKKVAK